MSTSENNKRIAKNTVMLYFRMLLIMSVTLYSSRVLLKELGIVDFGIYNVVGGVVSMLSFLNTSMANGYQRFFSIELGKDKGEGRLANLFSVSMWIQFLIILICLLIAETLGVWFLNNEMIIPLERVEAANWIFQFVIIMFILTLLRSPMQAIIIAYERMEFYAYISIIEVLANLGVIYLLSVFAFDRLIVYGVLMTIVAVSIFMSYSIAIKKINSGLSFKPKYDKNNVRLMLGFSGWNLFGALAHLLKGNGINILLNMFFGPAVNAARGIAFQISGGVMTLVSNFQLATRPQTMKYYAKGEINQMIDLFYAVSKFSYYLLWLAALPLFLEIDFILHLWLGDNVPAYTALFTNIVLATSLIEAFATPLTTIVHASGKMKKFQVICSSVILSIIPLSYVFLSFGYPPEAAMYVSLVVVCVVHLVRLVLIKDIIDFSISIYVLKVLCPCISVTIVSLLICYSIDLFVTFNPLIHILVLLLINSAVVFMLGLTSNEKSFVVSKINNLSRFFNKK